jgi:hypothetical protein
VAKPADFSAKSISELGLSPEVEDALRDVVASLGEDYRDAFVEMAQAINRQASALDRIQATLNVLVSKVIPEHDDRIPAAVSVAPQGTRADLAHAIIVADPIGAGYTLSQEALARALGITQTDVSILERALKLREDGSCAVVVRKGLHHDTVNFNARAIARFRELVANAQESSLNGNQKSALKRTRAAFAAADPKR